MLVLAVNAFLLVCVANRTLNRNWFDGWADLGVLWVLAPGANFILAFLGMFAVPWLRAYSDDNSLKWHITISIVLPSAAYLFVFVFIVSGVWK
jgi:hypothetical protein